MNYAEKYLFRLLLYNDENVYTLGMLHTLDHILHKSFARKTIPWEV